MIRGPDSLSLREDFTRNCRSSEESALLSLMMTSGIRSLSRGIRLDRISWIECAFWFRKEGSFPFIDGPTDKTPSSARGGRVSDCVAGGVKWMSHCGSARANNCFMRVLFPEPDSPVSISKKPPEPIKWCSRSNRCVNAGVAKKKSFGKAPGSGSGAISLRG